MNMKDQGDKVEFERLSEGCFKKLVGYFMTCVPCRLEEAEVLAQETLLKAWEDWKIPSDKRGPGKRGYDPMQGTPYYIFIRERFAKFIMRRERKKRKKKREWEFPEEDDSGIIEPSDKKSAHPDEVAIIAEYWRIKLRAFRELHRLIFLCGGYPHQQFTLVFSKVIYGTPSPRGIEGNPTKVAKNYGQNPLWVLANRYPKAFRKAGGTVNAAKWIEEDLALLNTRMETTVGYLTKLDTSSFENLRELCDRKTASTCLSDYHVGEVRSFPETISDWCDRVLVRVRRRLGIARGAEDENEFENRIKQAAEESKPPPLCNHCFIRHLCLECQSVAQAGKSDGYGKECEH